MSEQVADTGTPATRAWHAMTEADALHAQGVDPATGLSDAEVESRRATHGRNKFAEAAKEPRWRSFLRQYKDPMQIVLLVAGIVSMFLPGQLATGVDLVPADGRIIRAATLEIDEAALTGESAPVPKGLERVAAESALGDRIDMAFMNTQVTRGAGTILVTSTGMGTEVGHISDMLQETTADVTPLTRQLNTLTNQILVIAGIALLVSIGLGLYRDQPFQLLFLTAVAFSVSAIPTGLPAVVTTILANGTSTLA